MPLTKKLTAAAVKHATPLAPAQPGGKPRARYLSDGGNLFLQVSPSGSKSWIFRYARNGREREAGLGGLDVVSLAMARVRALDMRQQLSTGVDPLSAERTARREARRANSQRMSFNKAAEKALADRKLKTDKQRREWQSHFERFASPVIGRLDCHEVRPEDIAAVLRPIWTEMNPTARVILRRLQVVFDWWQRETGASGENPADTEAVEKLLPRVEHEGGHRAAIEWKHMPDAMAKLRALEGTAARAVEFLAHVGVREQVARLVTWSELDLDAAHWSIPAERMKMDSPFTVPLSVPVLDLLRALPSYHGGDFDPAALVFLSPRGRAYANSQLNDVLRDAGYQTGEATLHGLRTSVRSWIGDTMPDVPPHVGDAVIQHEKRGKLRRIYERTVFLSQREPIMKAWSAYLTESAKTVASDSAPPAEVLEAELAN
ncbi:integrase arm-type DNA-binding domain-containing protein [Caballeronia novacaledonica]|uniref:Integrase arm-type DNA-binding domain-containing protein n=1 Tax=Caballeronia novacaledonica TaxID=1544861 RepID=A0ACB5R4H1_9BURK|nr:integrase arm-type DNA-binding domain-containing protein [Caballeronia novacaledonica]